MNKATSVLVTGGAGFIGSHIVDRLIGGGYSVRVLDDLSTGKLSNISVHVKSGKVDFVEGNVRDASTVKTVVKDVDASIHLAAITSVPFSVENPNDTFETNVAGTLNLLNSCATEGVSKLVLFSSCAVYGDPEFLPVDEQHPANPISPYAESKLAAEKFCLGFHEKSLIKSVVLRLFNVYGPRQKVDDYSGVITRFVDRCNQKLPLTIYGDGTQTRDFINVQDVVEAVLKSLENNAAEGQIFNVGSGKPTSVHELAQTILEITHSNSEIRFDKPRTGDIKDSYANISKAEQLLGYKPRFNLRHGLQALIEQKIGAHSR